MNRGTILKLLALSPLSALALLGGAPEADARSQATIVGNPGSGSESSCFNFVTSFGSVRQVCDGTRTWILAPIYDNHGSMHVRVATFSPAAGDVVCKVRSVDNQGLNRIDGGSDTSNARFDDLSLVLSHAHGFGGVQVNCDMKKNAEIINVDY